MKIRSQEPDCQGEDHLLLRIPKTIHILCVRIVDANADLAKESSELLAAKPKDRSLHLS